MAIQIEELKRQRASLKALVGPELEGVAGTVRTELLAIQQKLSVVSADTPTEKVVQALQQEAALTLKLSRGAAELERVENEIRYAQEMTHSEAVRVEREQHEQQRKQASAIAQVKAIDDQLSGRKPIHVATGPAGQDYTDNMANARRYLERLREHVMQENGLTEADVTPPVPASDGAQLRPDGRGWT